MTPRAHPSPRGHFFPAAMFDNMRVKTYNCSVNDLMDNYVFLEIKVT